MNTSFVNKLAWILVAVMLCFAAFQVFAEDAEIWVRIDTKARLLNVMQGDQVKAVYKNIAIGRNGADKNRIRGDNTTPLGIYRIGWINNKSKFHKFFGVNYPSRMDARRALGQGLIDHETYEELVGADLLDRVPRQDTILGGQIGIHGLGSADPFIHETMDWTRGCIALTDQQIDSLDGWIKKGAVVVIR